MKMWMKMWMMMMMMLTPRGANVDHQTEEEGGGWNWSGHPLRLEGWQKTAIGGILGKTPLSATCWQYCSRKQLRCLKPRFYYYNILKIPVYSDRYRQRVMLPCKSEQTLNTLGF